MRLLLLSLLASSALALPVAAQVPPAPRDTIATRYQLPEADCALFPAAASMGTWNDEHLLKSGRFTPTHEQVATTEKALLAVRLQDVYEHRISGYYADYPAIIKNHLPEYNRQYYGFYNAQHQACLYINFFPGRYEQPSDNNALWLRWPVNVYDGGSGFWRIYYNLITHKFFNFSHNLEG